MNRLKELRQEKGIKQTELARILSVGQQAISKYETGKLDIGTDTIAALCEIFGVTSDYLLGISSQRSHMISDADYAIIEAYHAADDDAKAIVAIALKLDSQQQKKPEAVG